MSSRPSSHKERCRCGSGRQYKACCYVLDRRREDEAAAQARRGPSRPLPLVAFDDNEHLRDIAERVNCEYPGAIIVSRETVDEPPRRMHRRSPLSTLLLSLLAPLPPKRGA